MGLLWDKLSQPFPEEGTVSKSLQSLIGVSVFIGFFLFLLKPFGLSARTDLPLLSIGFGLVTFTVGFIHDLIVRRLIRLRTDLPTWTLGKWILNMLSLILLITLGNFIFMNWWSGWIGLDLSSLLNVLVNTALVGIIPVVFFGFVIQNREARRNAAEATKIDLKEASTPKTSQSILINDMKYDIDQIRFIEAQQNYISIHFHSEGQVQTELVRLTFTKLEELLKDSNLIRCHRSFFVNRDAVVEIKGNAQGLKLTLKDLVDTTIPVSKSYTKKVKQALARP